MSDSKKEKRTTSHTHKCAREAADAHMHTQDEERDPKSRVTTPVGILR